MYECGRVMCKRNSIAVYAQKSRDSNGKGQLCTFSQIDRESVTQTFNVSANVLMTRTSGMSSCRSVYTHHFDVKLVNYGYILCSYILLVLYIIIQNNHVHVLDSVMRGRYLLVVYICKPNK